MSETLASPIAQSDVFNSRSHDVTDIAQAGLAEFISFAIGADQYGVDIMAVREIREWSDVTPLPKQPNYVRGVLNLRGVVMPIIDLRCRFGEGLTEVTPTSVIIIVQVDGRQMGLLADRVLDIVSFEREKIQPVPRTTQGASADFLAGLVTEDDNMMALIDLQALFAASGNDVAEGFREHKMESESS